MSVTVHFSNGEPPVNLSTEDTLMLTPIEGKWAGCNFDAPIVLMPKMGFEAQADDARFGRAIRNARRGMPQWKRTVAHVLGIY